MTDIMRGVPCADNGAAIPTPALAWQNQTNAELVGLWSRSACWLDNIGGTPISMTAEASPPETAYGRNRAYWLIPDADNPTSVEIDIDGLGVRAIVDALGDGLTGGELRAGALHLLVDDGAQLRLMLAGAGGGSALGGDSAAPDIILEDQKNSGVAGGSFASALWAVRDLTTAVRNVMPAATFSPNRIALPAGTYFARWSCPASACGVHRSRLYNETDAAVIAYGTSEREVVGTGDTSRSSGSACFTLPAGKTLVLQHRCSDAAATNGFGQPSGLATEIYSRLEIWKVGASDTEVVGVPGGAHTYLFTFSSTTTDADPGAGFLRLNAAAGSATQAFIDTTDFYFNDLSAVLPTIATSTSSIKARMRIAKRGEPTKWALYDVLGDTAASGYRKFTLSNPQTSASLFASGDVVIVTFDTVGQRGLQGTPGDLPKVLGKQSTPPVSPTTGDAYIVSETGTGAWAGHDNTIATWNGSAWTFNTPADDDLVFDKAANELDYFDDASDRYISVSTGDPRPENFGAVGDFLTNPGSPTDDTVALQAFLDACENGRGRFTPGKQYGFAGRLIVRDGSWLDGRASGIKALATAPNNSASLNLTDAGQGSAPGPSYVTIEGLTINGNATARRAGGVLTNMSGVGNAAGVYCMGASHVTLRDMTVIDAEGDCYYIGGIDGVTGRSVYFRFDNCYGTGPSRNVFSVVGAQRGSFSGCIATAASYGAAHSNISNGWDFEPDGSNSANEDITVTGCEAVSCATEGFGFHNSAAYNININLMSPIARSCAVGFGAGTAGHGVRIIAARYAGNTTNFVNVAEALASFP